MSTITVGDGGYATIAEAIAAAAAGDTIIVKAGSYAEDVTFGATTPDNLTIQAEGEVKITGSFTLATGYNNKAKGLVIDGFDFETAGNSLIINVAYGVTVKNCSFTAESGNCIQDTSQKSGKGNILFDSCTINSPVQIYGGNLTDGRAFEFANCDISAKVNVQSGYETRFTDCNFKFTVTDANNNDSFYGIRSNTTPVIIDGGTVTVDSTVTDATPGDSSWAVFWQRQNSTNQWEVSGLEVTYTDAAKANGKLIFNNNADTANNSRIVIDDTCVIPADVLATSAGIMEVAGKNYCNGDVVTGNILYVNNTWTEATVPAGKVWGVNAFADVESAVAVFTDGDVIAMDYAELGEDIKINEDGAKDIVLTGNVGYVASTSKAVRVYGNATVDGFEINSGYKGATVSASGKFLVYGDTLITGNTVMKLNAFQTTNSGVIDSNVVINTANFNAYDNDSATDAKFVVKGTLNTVSFIVTNDYYTAGNDELTVAEGGVLTVKYASGNGRMSLQTGAVTVYGYVDADLSSGGGSSNFGSGEGYAMNLTIDGTYAAEDNNNGKLIKVGNQKLSVNADSQLNVINGAEFSWEGDVVGSDAAFNVADSKFAVTSLVNDGSFNISGNSEVNIGKFSGIITIAGGTVLTNSAIAFEEAAYGKVIANGDLTINYGALTGMDDVVIAGDLAITGVELPAEGAVVTLLAGSLDMDGSLVSVNGSAVVDNKVTIGNNVYAVNAGDSAITLTLDAVVPDDLAVKVSGYSQSADENYIFTIDCTATGGSAEYTYSVQAFAGDTPVAIVSSSKDGRTFAFVNVPESEEITVTVTVNDGYSTVTSKELAIKVKDYTAPVFPTATRPAVTVEEDVATITWAAEDNFAVTDYLVEVNGTKYNTTETSLTLEGLANGDYAVKVTALDAAGNKKSLETDFAVAVFGDKPAAVTDFNADNVSDVILGSEALVKILASSQEGFVTTAVGIVDDGWKVVGTGYLNADGYNDVLLQNENGEVKAWFVGADGYEEQTLLDGAVASEWEIIGTGDVNGDGMDDIIVSKTSVGEDSVSFTEIAAFQSSYNGSFAGITSLGGYAPGEWEFVAAVDMDGDTKDDILLHNVAVDTNNQKSDLYGYWQSGAKGNNFVAIAGGVSDWTYSGIGDFDGDGSTEILWTHAESGVVGYWEGVGAENTIVKFGSAFDAELDGFSIAGTGDYDGNGSDDILWAADNGEKKAWLMDGGKYSATAIIAC